MFNLVTGTKPPLLLAHELNEHLKEDEEQKTYKNLKKIVWTEEVVAKPGV